VSDPLGARPRPSKQRVRHGVGRRFGRAAPASTGHVHIVADWVGPPSRARQEERRNLHATGISDALPRHRAGQARNKNNELPYVIGISDASPRHRAGQTRKTTKPVRDWNFGCVASASDGAGKKQTNKTTKPVRDWRFGCAASASSGPDKKTKPEQTTN
jgi:hypothetical protein